MFLIPSTGDRGFITIKQRLCLKIKESATSKNDEWGERKKKTCISYTLSRSIRDEGLEKRGLLGAYRKGWKHPYPIGKL